MKICAVAKVPQCSFKIKVVTVIKLINVSCENKENFHE